MSPFRFRSRRLATDEAGMTLVELLIAAVLGIAVISAAMIVFTRSVNSQPEAAKAASGLSQARTAMDRMTRELRQGSLVSSSSSSAISVVTYVDEATCGGSPAATAIACRVIYSCSRGACTRRVAQP